MTHRRTSRRAASWWLAIVIALVAATTLFAGGALPAGAIVTDSGTCTFDTATYTAAPGGAVTPTIQIDRTDNTNAGSVTLSIQNYQGIFGGVNANQTIAVSFAAASSSATVSLPNASSSASLGAVANLSLTTPTDCSTSSDTATLTVAAPAPTVSNINPSNGSVSGGTNVTITGTNFYNPVTSVTIGGTPATNVVRVNSTTITATTPPGSLGPAAVVVTINGVGSTGAVNFTYNANTPTISSINPNSGSVGTPTTITGTNFLGTSCGTLGDVHVYFGATQATCLLVNSTTINANAPSGSGTVSVTVQTTNGTSNGVNFTYGASGAPVITSVAPSSGPVGTTLQINGSNLTPATVTVGGVNCPVGASSSVQVFCTTQGGVTAGVPQNVTLSNGVSSDTAFNAFTYTNSSTVTVTSVVPNSCTLAGGTTLTVTGTGFVAGFTTVSINGVLGTNVNVLNANTLTVTCPPQNFTGTYDLTVTVNSVSSPNTSADNVTYTTTGVAPIISSVSPSSGPTTGGTTVTITGANFSSPASVLFDGIPSSSVTVNSSGIITAITPAHPATGLVSVVVTTSGGSDTDPAAFNYTNAAVPVVTGLSPTSGPAGTLVTISGSNFTGATGVTFGGVAASFNFVSDSTITATVPSGAPLGVINVLVTNAAGTSANTSADNFTNTSTNLITILLQGRFTLIGWVGLDNISVADALRGGPNGAQGGTNDITSQVSVVWGFDNTTQTWQGYFPGSTSPGANDLTTLSAGMGYFIALNNPASQVSWTYLVIP